MLMKHRLIKCLFIAAFIGVLASCSTVPSKPKTEADTVAEKAFLTEWSRAIMKAQFYQKQYDFAKDCGDEDLALLYGDMWNSEILRARNVLNEYLARTEE